MRRNLNVPPNVSATCILLMLCAAPAVATDVDGPDCGHVIHDFGDAPEGVRRFGPLQQLAAFPTCVVAGPVGTVESIVPTRGTAPGAAGFVHHVQNGSNNYWLGCNGDVLTGIGGVDSEVDGKFSDNGPSSGCAPFITVDTFAPDGAGQDEYGNDSDAGVGGAGSACSPYTALFFTSGNCGPARTVYLNILCDLNDDGDWNDNLPCRDVTSPYCIGPCTSFDGAAHEWAVKNLAITIPAGCANNQAPAFETGATGGGTVWLRMSLSDAPVSDDFPWAGSATAPGGTITGGETEDLPFDIMTPLPAHTSTWGALKLRYQ